MFKDFGRHVTYISLTSTYIPFGGLWEFDDDGDDEDDGDEPVNTLATHLDSAMRLHPAFQLPRY